MLVGIWGSFFDSSIPALGKQINAITYLIPLPGFVFPGEVQSDSKPGATTIPPF